MFRSSLKRTSLLRSALFRSPLVRTLAGLFDKLKNLSQPMVVAYEGDNPLETGRYPQPPYCVSFDGATQYISATHLTGSETVVDDYGSTATPTVSAGRIDFTAGNCYGVELSDGTYYDCGESSGTILLDRNDNSNPGTLVNGTARITDANMPWQADVTNEEGYTLGTGSNGAAVGVIIPPSTIDPTKDCLGNDLQFSGSVYPVIPVPEGSSALSPALIDLPFIFNLGSGMELEWELLATANDVNLFSGVGNSWFRIRSSLNSLQGYLHSTYTEKTVNYDFVLGERYKFKMVITSNDAFDVYVNDLFIQSITWPDVFTGPDRVYLGREGQSVGAELTHVKISDLSGDIVEYDFTETSGTTVFDTSGKGNHGTLVNGTTWVNTRDGYGTNLNQLRGFTLDGAVRIPALADGSGLDARDGLPLTNPPVLPYGHNDSENTENAYEISETGSPTAASTNLANFAAVTFSDTRTDLQTTLPIDAVYRRDFSTVNKDRFIAFYDTLTGDDKELAEQYTEPPTFSYSPSLDFSDGRNSQYLPLI